MEDIEDVGHTQLPGADESHQPSKLVSRAGGKKKVEKHGENVPGDATVFVHTFGCGHNVSDGEYMAGLLVEDGYRVTDDFNNADAYLINSCTVKNPSEDHFVTMMKRAKTTGKPVVVAGCVPQGDPKNQQWSDVSIVGVRHIDQVTSVVEEALRGNTTRLLSNDTKETIPKLEMKKVRRNKWIEIIPINVGCLNFCTYCKTKHARGNLKSWPIEEIVARVRAVMAEGVKEIRLTSEDTGAYGIDIGLTVVQLLEAIVKELEGTDVMLRVGMSNPPYLLRQVEGFAKVLLHPNVYEFIHIPVQSGSNAILDTMKREYSREEFEQCCDTFYKIVPKISIATDIICAFPGEGEAEWEDTMSLCRKYKFPVLNISRFYSRRGTPAASMQQVPTEISKKRSVEITKLLNSYSCYDSLLGTQHKVTLLEVAHDKHHLVGHTKNYVQVLVDPKEAKLGETVFVKVTEITRYSVKGKRIEGSAVVGDRQQAVKADKEDTKSTTPAVVAASSPAQKRQRLSSNAILAGAAVLGVMAAIGISVIKKKR